jgi:hypothetical protein
MVKTMSLGPILGLNRFDLCDERSTPLAFMSSTVSSVAGVPSVASSPAESTLTLEMPLSCRSFLAKPSAMGLLHALAEQTKRILTNLEGGDRQLIKGCRRPVASLSFASIDQDYSAKEDSAAEELHEGYGLAEQEVGVDYSKEGAGGEH